MHLFKFKSLFVSFSYSFFLIAFTFLPEAIFGEITDDSDVAVSIDENGDVGFDFSKNISIVPDIDPNIKTNHKPSCNCRAPTYTGSQKEMQLQYSRARSLSLEEEDKELFGGDIVLTELEKNANKIIMKYKRREFRQGLDTNMDKEPFPASFHFYHVMKLIEASNVYKIIQKFPKAGVLHLHDLQSGSMDYVAKNLTRLPNLYLCFDNATLPVLRFTFSNFPPLETSFCAASSWILVEDFRKNASSLEYVDQLFLSKMTLFTDTPEIYYPDNNAAWRVFLRTILTTGGILGYEKATRLYFKHLLRQFYDDNCQYVEVRSLLEFFYRLDDNSETGQSPLSSKEVLQLFKEVTDEFVKETNGDFWGAKIIYSPRRTISVDEMNEKLADAVLLKQEYPDFLAGFDMAYHEDCGNPLFFYKNGLIKAKSQGLEFFFHAGETDWHGTYIDDNLLDAILLNATRIGHGTALNARPYIVDRIMECGTCVEVNPISSQVLKLSSADIRTHPSIALIRKGFPLIVSCDDAGSLTTNNLSFDWYIAFMALAGQRTDLRFLKKLALNSISCSAMSDSEKNRARKKWEIKYNRFLKEIIRIDSEGNGF